LNIGAIREISETCPEFSRRIRGCKYGREKLYAERAPWNTLLYGPHLERVSYSTGRVAMAYERHDFGELSQSAQGRLLTMENLTRFTS